MEARERTGPPEPALERATPVPANGPTSGPFSLPSMPDGRYRQKCRCATRRLLAERDAKRIARDAEEAFRDAVACETDDDPDGAQEFRAQGRELEDRVAELLADLPEDTGGCPTCANTREVVGNGTYGGPAKRQRVLMQVV